MALSSELEKQGTWLFRWRGYLPLLVAPVIIGAIASARWPLGSHRLHEWWDVLCFSISLLGFGIRVHVVGHAPVGTSGRNVPQQVAHSLTTTGLYSVVRHPLYLGNYLIALGAVLVPFVWWSPLLFTALFWIYYERIMFAEEAFLRRTYRRQFVAWAQRTPAFLPRIAGWVRPAKSFNVRSVLRNEYTALAMVALLHAVTQVAAQLVVAHRATLGRGWTAVLVAGLSTYVLLRSVKRHTTCLDVSDR